MKKKIIGHSRWWHISHKYRLRKAKQKAKLLRITRNCRKKTKYRRERGGYAHNRVVQQTLFAPKYFALLQYPENVLSFIQKIEKILLKNSGVKIVKFELCNVSAIDIGAICLFLSKLNELSKRNIRSWGTFPSIEQCKKVIVDSGFLDRMKDVVKKATFPRNNKNLILNRGFDRTDNAATAREIRKAVQHLTGVEDNYKPIYSIAQEICANSVEHANEDKQKKNWLFSTSYMEDKVIFTMTDIGEGILKTIRRKFFKQIQDSMLNDSKEILLNAFEKQYESRTKDPNRNKGLPKIYNTSQNKHIENLIVITNNVFLDFENPQNSKILKNKFKGTFYYWTLNKECIERWRSRFTKLQ